MGTTTPNFSLYVPADGETGWGTGKVDQNWLIIDSNLTNSLPRSYLAGCQLTPNAGSPTTKIDFTAGQAQDVGNAGAMILAATTKDISASWVVGTGNGGLAPSLTLTASTTYHAFVIKRTDTNVVDAYFDTSVTAVNIPTPYTLFRRVGSLRTDGASHILAFVQDGDYFRLKASVLDVNTTQPGTSAVTATLTSVPTGLNVLAFFNFEASDPGNANAVTIQFSDLAVTDEAPSTTAAPLGMTRSVASSAVGGFGSATIRTNTSSQIRYRVDASSATSVVRIATLGWYDRRGKDA